MPVPGDIFTDPVDFTGPLVQRGTVGLEGKGEAKGEARPPLRRGQPSSCYIAEENDPPICLPVVEGKGKGKAQSRMEAAFDRAERASNEAIGIVDTLQDILSRQAAD
eukprot:10955528-Heterocapsa_arctica.AAC.1